MRLLGIPVLAVGILAAPAARGLAVPDEERCDTLAAARPDDEETAYCFLDLAREAGFRDLAVRRLESLLAQQPERPWLRLVLGFLRQEGGADRAALEALYRKLAGDFVQRGVTRGEALARINLQFVLIEQRYLDEASLESERSMRVAAASGDPLLLARDEIVRAVHRFYAGKDLGEAYTLLQHAEAIVARNPHHKDHGSVAKTCLRWLGTVGAELGLFDEVRGHFERLLDLAIRDGDLVAEASARYGLARVAVERLAELPEAGQETRAKRLAAEALAAAERSGNPRVPALAHWMLAQLSTGRESQEHLDRCLELAAGLWEKGSCLNALARHLATANPHRAGEAAAQAFALSGEPGHPLMIAAAKATRMRVAWETAPREQAISAALEALDTLEELREFQSGASAKPSFFSTWSDEYAWVAGRLLEVGRLAEAFSIQEHLRARALLDTLAQADAVPAPRRQLEERRAVLRSSLERVHGRLRNAELAASEREHARRDLGQLKFRVIALEEQLARPGPAPVDAGQWLADLADVQGALAEDEALLSFQVAPWKDWTGGFGGGSWLLVATRGAPPRVYRLMGREKLREEVCHFARLVAPVQQPCGRRIRRNVTREAQAAILYRQLLGDALDELPAGIRRLVVIPDDALYRLPFAALRESEEADPLGLRFQISVVPSATLALRWRGSRTPMGEVPLLAVANPPAPSREQRSRLQRAGIPLPPLPDLPDAVREARAAVRALGRDSVLHGESEVSERFLKEAARGGGLRRYAALHFAGHAIVDDRRFQSSGLWLSPGAPREDGLLQIQEIVGLDLDGRIVVLAACRSASGAVLRGEGVMSLARAFFQAGAHAVVGSLWPLADEDGEAFFGRFYHHLARGRSVAAALQAAQRDRIADGARDDAWAGLVVLGNGDLVPLPGGRSLLERHGAILAFGAALLLLYLLLAYARRRRQPS